MRNEQGVERQSYQLSRGDHDVVGRFDESAAATAVVPDRRRRCHPIRVSVTFVNTCLMSRCERRCSYDFRCACTIESIEAGNENDDARRVMSSMI